MKKIINLMIDEFSFWFNGFLTFLPGRIGNFIRNIYYFRNYSFKNIISIDINCIFNDSCNMQFGRRVTIGRNSIFSAKDGSIIVGDNCQFNTNVHINASIGGSILLGKHCLVGPNVVIRSSNHKYKSKNIKIQFQGHVSKNIVIEDDVWIGANVSIIPGAFIGEGSVIGAGSVVNSIIPPFSVACGIPAKIVKNRK